MFQKGEYVVCGGKGVCQVENITGLHLSGADKDREYYILKPVYMTGSTVYVPVDTAEKTMRRVLNRREADKLIEEIPAIPLIVLANDKQLEQEYRSCMRSNCCEEWMKIIKTAYLRRQKRLEEGRKATETDSRYFRLAEEELYGELAISLNLERNQVEDYILQEMNKDSERDRV